MRQDQTNEIASGAGYERLMSRLKSQPQSKAQAQARTVYREPNSFKATKEDDVEVRTHFGKRRSNQV